MTQAPETCNSPDSISSKPGSNSDQAVNVALAPCPFCGATPEITERAATEAERHAFMCFIACMCGGYSARAHQYGGGETKFEAQETASIAWNRRVAPALPQDVAAHLEKLENLAKWVDHDQHKKWNGKAGIPVHGFSGEGKVIRAAASLLLSQSSTIASAREVIEQLLPAAEKVLEGLHARIDAAENSAVPVFYGISDLHDAIGAARDWKGR